MKIAAHTAVSIEYHLTDDSGTVLDSSQGQAPLSYVHGTESLVPGLESELEGRSAGDEFKVRVPPELAYGMRDEGMVHSVPREQFPAGDVVVGMQVQARMDDGEPVVLTVVGLEKDSVRLDANHPLAGMHLNFAIKVVDVRPATAEEIEHGHVHGADGHDHGDDHGGEG